MNNALIDISALLVFIPFLSGFGQQVTEYLFGGMLTVTPIRFVAIAVPAFAFRLIGGAPILAQNGWYGVRGTYVVMWHVIEALGDLEAKAGQKDISA